MFPLRLKKACEDSVRAGMPWIYSGDVIESSELLHVLPGSLVAIENHKGQPVGIGYFNAKSQIACRVLALGRCPIDTAFFTSRIGEALAKREKIVGVPYYRLVHSEADHLPGLLIDRFGDILVVQVGTAGMEQLQPLWMAALEEVLEPRTIILRNDIPARVIEGLKQEVVITPSPVPADSEQVVAPFPLRQVASGDAALTLPRKREKEYIVEVKENDCVYYADLIKGQKTGWFFDQRDNRRMIAELAKGKTLLDVYSHSGGFAILAAKQGAAQVTLVDSSATALQLADKAVGRNGVSGRCDMIQGDAFAVMERLQKEGKKFDMVLADPPAFVKSKKDIGAGLKGYAKVARLAAQLVKPEGLLFVASCSHHAGRSAFNKAVLGGIAKAGREAIILKQTGASSDHPRHKRLPQNEYLKGILLKIT